MIDFLLPYLKSKRMWVVVLGVAFSFLAHHGHVYHVNTDALSDHIVEIVGAGLILVTKIVDTVKDKRVRDSNPTTTGASN
jgi:putative Ca2+/H+ antiporter (TMEM165/GDT1 family)